jgi:hypothetical protein
MDLTDPDPQHWLKYAAGPCVVDTESTTKRASVSESVVDADPANSQLIGFLHQNPVPDSNYLSMISSYLKKNSSKFNIISYLTINYRTYLITIFFNEWVQ